jgi:class 3 adenylate cyclase/tetratricopeptide (TPR) repeat protein
MVLSTERFVGRQSELSELRQGLENARSGRGQLVLLKGEPGIGKSRLSDEVSKLAGSIGFKIAWGRSWENEGAPAYWPWTEVLRSCLGNSFAQRVASGSNYEGTKTAGSRAADQEPVSIQLEQWLNQRKPTKDSAYSFSSPTRLAENQGERAWLFESVLQLLTDLSLSQPILLVFDDFHSADQDSLLLLQFIARHVHSLQVMIVATLRNSDSKVREEGEDIVATLAREGKTINLHGLNPEEVREVVNEYTGQAQGSLATRLAELTEGNPFFLTEIVRLISSEGSRGKSRVFKPADFNIPRSVSKAIERRFEASSTTVRDLLTVASVIGRQFDPAVLARISGKSLQEVLNLLDEAIDAALISPELVSSGKYQFRHALITETLYDEIPTHRRRALHLSVANFIEEIYSTDLEPYFSELAHHHVSALPAGDIQKAARYAELGARRALSMLAYQEASRLYEISLRALGPASDLHRRCRLLLDLAFARASAEDAAELRLACEEAASIARELDLPGEFAEAALYYGWQTSGFGTVDRKLVDILEEALSLIGSKDDGMRAKLLARLVQELYWSGQASRRDELSAESVRLARSTSDPGVLVRALYARYLALWRPETNDERFAVLSELVQVAEHNGLKIWRQRSSWPFIGELFAVGDLVGAGAEIENHAGLDLELKRQTGFPEAARAARALLEGRFEEGEQLATMALNIAGQRDPAFAQIFASQISLVRREQGRAHELIPIIETIVGQLPRLTFARCGLASCYADSDRRAQATAEFEHLATDEFSGVPRDATWIASMVLLADVCCYLLDTSRALILYKFLVPYASRNAVLGSQVCYGAVDYYLAKLAFRAQLFADAEQHFKSALRLNLAMGARPWTAHTQYEYAVMLRARNGPSDGEQSRALLGASHELATALEMPALVSRICEFERAGGSTPANVNAQPLVATTTNVQEHGSNCLLFVDIEGTARQSSDMGERGWRDLLHRVHGIAHQQVRRMGAKELEEHQGGFIAIFAEASTAILAASSIRDSLARFKITTKAGVYAPEQGVAIIKARALLGELRSKLVTAAAPGEIILSSTSKSPATGFAIQLIGTEMLDVGGGKQDFYFFRVEMSNRPENQGARPKS